MSVCVCVLTDMWINRWIVNILADIFPALIYGLLSDTVNTLDYRASTDLLMNSGQKRMLNEIECIYWVTICS